MTLREAVAAAVDGRTLARVEIVQAFEEILSGGASPALISALLIALRMRGETPDEIAGAASVLRARAIAVRAAPQFLVDTCGTGGDGAGTFNISTCAGFVAAGAGARVAKHGNRAVSSRCGSADVLAALGVRIDAPPAVMAACLESEGIAFLFAQNHHAAMRHVAPVRKELGLRTIFNLLGPLINPAGVRRHVLGVYDVRLVDTMARALIELGAERAFVVHGAGGLDEITPYGTTQIAEVKDGSLRRFSFSPEEIGLAPSSPQALAGGDASENATLLRRVLDGEHGPKRDAVLLNAGAAIAAAGLCETIAEGVTRAATAIDNGAARLRLDALIRRSNAEVI